MSVEVSFRTLSGGKFKLSVQPNDTILDVKKKIADEQKESDHVGYKLIFKGKVLDDAATVTSSGVSEAATNFVVVMPPRKSRSAAKPAPPAKPAASEQKQPVADKSVPAPDNATEPKPNDTTPSDPPASAAAGPSLAANSLVTGQAYEQSLRQICDMGFPEDQVKRALRAAYNNPERAVEFLFNGIPENLPAEPAPTAPSAPPATQQNPPASGDQAPPPTSQTNIPFNMFELPQGDDPSRTGTETNSLDFLRSIPQFNLMRRLIQANPAVLPQILQRLESINPQLMAIIDANQEEFTRLINEPVNESEESEAEGINQLTQAMASAGAGGAGGPPQDGNEVYVSEEEHQQITRLTELASNLGIHRAQVLQTWLACNRDEALAANFLVDHAAELVADQSAGDGGADPARNEES